MSDTKDTAAVVLTTKERQLVTRLLLIEQEAEARYLAALELVDGMPDAANAARRQVQMLTGLISKLDEAYFASVCKAAVA